MAKFKRLGRSLVPADADAEADVMRISPGGVIDVKITKKRSHPHHRFYHALIKSAFDNWGELHEFQPENTEHLRKWLQAKAGYADYETIDFDKVASEAQRAALSTALETAFRAERRKGVYVWVRPYRNGIAIIRPRSIAFDQIGESEFRDVSSKVIAVVEQETGISIDDLCPDTESAQWARSLEKI